MIGPTLKGAPNWVLGTTLEAIRGIGLRVCLPKTEAYGFHCSWNPLPGNRALRLEESEVRVGGVLKYLGVTLDSRLSFAQHLAAFDSKLRATSASSGRLMPNLRGPGDVTRKLYVTVVHTIDPFSSRQRLHLAELKPLPGPYPSSNSTTANGRL